MPKITKRTVEDAPIRQRDYFIWCDELPGFGVRIYPSGKRGYLVQYRSAGRTRRAKIGIHGRITAEEARREAKALLGEVAKGGDPAEERATQRAAMTIRDLCDRYLAASEKGLVLGKYGMPKKPENLEKERSKINRHIVPLLGNRRVRDLSRPDVVRFVRDVTSGKTAVVEKTGNVRGKSIVEGGAGAASRTVGLLGGILTFAVTEGVIPTNPVHGVKRHADQKRTARLTPDTYRQLGTALEKLAEERRSETAVNAIWLLCLTGCRKGEIENLRWTEVDLSGHALRLADSKEGASVRPLGTAAIELLERIPRKPGCDFVCPGRHPNRRYGGLPGAWERIAKAARLSGITLHTMRHSFASTAADLGFTEVTIAAILGHSSGTITSRYIHHLDAVLIAATTRIADSIRTQMTSGSSLQGRTPQVTLPTTERGVKSDRKGSI